MVLSLNTAVIDRLQHMLPAGFRLEDELLSSSEFSRERMSDAAPNFFDTEKKVSFPALKMLYFLQSNLSPEENVYSLFTPKEKEVDRFLKQAESRLLLAITPEERRRVLEDVIHITHLPYEVVNSFYVKTHHRILASDFPNLENLADSEVDRPFCYEFAQDFMRCAHEWEKVRNSTSQPVVFQLDQHSLNGLLLAGSKEALQKQQEKYAQHQQGDRGFVLMHGRFVDLESEDGRDFFHNLDIGMEMLRYVTPQNDREQKRREGVLLKYKEFCRDIIDSPLLLLAYAKHYAYCCYETKDEAELGRMAEAYLGVIQENRMLKLEEWHHPEEHMTKSLFIAWHARKKIESKADSSLDARVEKVSANLKARIRRLLPRIAHPAKDEVQQFVTFFRAADLVYKLGDSETEYALLEALAEGQQRGFQRAYVYAADVLSHYFPDEYTPVVPVFRMQELSFARNRLSAEELSHWRSRMLTLSKSFPTFEDSPLPYFFEFESIHSRLAEQATANANLTEAQRQWKILGIERDAYLTALELLTGFPNLDDQQKQNLLESSLLLVQQRHPLSEKLKVALEETLRRAVDESPLTDLERYMRSAAELGSVEVLVEGARRLHGLGAPLYKWFRNYWQIDLPLSDATLSHLLQQEAEDFLERQDYPAAHLIYRKLDPAQGTPRFLQRLYQLRIQDVDQGEGEVTLHFTNLEGETIKVSLHQESLRGRGSIEVQRHSLVVENHSLTQAGRQVVVTKRNDDQRMTEIEYKVLRLLRDSGVAVATPLSCQEADITMEYFGRNLLEYAQSPERDTRTIRTLLRRALRQRAEIGRSLSWILDDDEKEYLQRRQLQKMSSQFQDSFSTAEIAAERYTFRALAALGYDEQFRRAYHETVEKVLHGFPSEYQQWLKDSFAGNFALDGTQVVSFDFNNLTFDVAMLDESLLLHSFGLRLDKAEEARLRKYAHSLGTYPSFNQYSLAFTVSSIHRNILQMGNIVREYQQGKTPRLVMEEEAKHYATFAQVGLRDLRREELTGISKMDLQIVEDQIQAMQASLKAA